jgi:hypothetical protein
MKQRGVDPAAVSEPYFPGIEPLRFFLSWPDSINKMSAFRLVAEFIEIDYSSTANVPYFNAGVQGAGLRNDSDCQEK